MRVAQVMAGAALGGAELFFERLCAALHRAGEDILPVIRRDEARAARLAAAGLAPAELAFGGPLDLRTRPQLDRLLRQFRPAVAVAWMSRAIDHLPRGDWVRVGRLGGYYRLDHFRGCDHLIGNTRFLVDWLRKQGWPEARTHYLPNFVPDFADVAAARDVPNARPLLLALGRLHTDKAFDVLIRAMPRLPAATLLIAGEGPEDSKLRRLARAEGVAERVLFQPWREDTAALLKTTDVFVCPSRLEPLGNVVLEAWSAGCPVVAAAADGPRELIAHDGDGLLVPVEDPVALADAISSLLDDRARAAALAAAGRAQFLARFSEAPVVARWRAFLQSVASEPRAPAGAGIVARPLRNLAQAAFLRRTQRGKPMSDRPFTREDLDILKQWDTPTVCNGLEIVMPERRAIGFTVEPLVPVDRGFPPIVGLARTGMIRAKEPPRGKVPAREEWYDYVAPTDLPTVAVIQDLDDRPGYGAFWGEVNTTIHKALGVIGCVTNGSFRDLDMLAPDFQIIGGRIGPSHAHVHVVDYGRPVNVFGMYAVHDDVIHADFHGAVVIPAQAVRQLPKAIELVARREKVILDMCAAPNFSPAKLREALRRAAEIH